MNQSLVAIASALIVGSAVLISAPLSAQPPQTHQHSFSGADKWAHIFDDPKRDERQKPHQVIQALALKPDAVVADIGSGTGYFSVRLSNMVSKGRVYGVDVEPDMVRYLAERAKREKRANITAIAGTPDDPRLPEKVDLILMVDVFHHVENRAAYFRKLQSFLKPGGRIAIIDFRMDSRDGPPKSERISPEGVIGELKGAGYALSREHGFLPDQYFLVFESVSKAP